MDSYSFPWSFALGEALISRFDGMSESDKEDAIFRCRDAKSESEVQQILDNLSVEDRSAIIDAANGDQLL